VPTSIPPAPEEEELDADDVEDVDDDDEGPPELEDEPTFMPPTAPMPPFPGPFPPSPPTFVPPDPFVVPDGSLREPLAEQATMTKEERTEIVRRRVACFTRPGSEDFYWVSSGWRAGRASTRCVLGSCVMLTRVLYWRLEVRIMKTRTVLLFLVSSTASAVLGCVPDDDNSHEARCDRRAFACVNSCYKAGQGSACRLCCQESATACKKNESFSFYDCPGKDDR